MDSIFFLSKLANFRFHVATKYFWLVALGVAFDLSLQGEKIVDGHMSVKIKNKNGAVFKHRMEMVALFVAHMHISVVVTRSATPAPHCLTLKHFSLAPRQLG